MRLGEKHNKNADAEVVPPPHNPPHPPVPTLLSVADLWVWWAL